MAAGTTLIPVEEYLRTNYKPNCEYIDGVLRPKPMGTLKHGRIQASFIRLIVGGNFEIDPEVTVRIREGKYLIPDLIVQRKDAVQDPYPTAPVHVCIEILSPGDRVSELFAKCEEYHAWGVEMAWIVDPESRRAWEYPKGQLFREVPPDGCLIAEGISVSMASLFSAL